MTTSRGGGGGAKEATPLFSSTWKKRRRRERKKPPKPEEDDEEEDIIIIIIIIIIKEKRLNPGDPFLCGLGNEKHTDDDAFKARVKALIPRGRLERDSCGLFSLEESGKNDVAARPPDEVVGFVLRDEESREERERERRRVIIKVESLV